MKRAQSHRLSLRKPVIQLAQTTQHLPFLSPVPTTPLPNLPTKPSLALLMSTNQQNSATGMTAGRPTVNPLGTLVELNRPAHYRETWDRRRNLGQEEEQGNKNDKHGNNCCSTVERQNLKIVILNINHCTSCELCLGTTPGTTPGTTIKEKPPWLSQKLRPQSTTDPPQYSGRVRLTDPKGESPKKEKNIWECKHNRENRIKIGNKLITIPNTKCYTPCELCSPRMPSESTQQRPPPKPGDNPEHLENGTISRKPPEPDHSPGELPARKESPCEPQKHASRSQQTINPLGLPELAYLPLQSLRLAGEENGHRRAEHKHNHDRDNIIEKESIVVPYKNNNPSCEMCPQKPAPKPDPQRPSPDSGDTPYYLESMTTTRPPPEPDPKRQPHKIGDATKQRNATKPEWKDQPICRPTRKKKSPAAHTSQNRGATVKPPPEPDPPLTDWLNRSQRRYNKNRREKDRIPTRRTNSYSNSGLRNTLVDNPNKYRKALEIVSKIASELGLVTDGREGNKKATRNYCLPGYQIDTKKQERKKVDRHWGQEIDYEKEEFPVCE
jgi:hypothetical protein